MLIHAKDSKLPKQLNVSSSILSFLVSMFYLHLKNNLVCASHYFAHNIQHHRPLYCILGKLFSFFLIALSQDELQSKYSAI